MILLIDNYDSFVFNLARYFEKLGHETTVVRNDKITVEQVRELAPRALVVSPGPCTPNQAGISLDLIDAFHSTLPILGICLGHQAIGQSFGATIVRAEEPMHGRASSIDHDSTGVFQGINSPFNACRYHSLVVDRDTLPESLKVNAWTSDNVVMGIQHTDLPIVGWQFHPESILSENGFSLLTHFLRLAGLTFGGPGGSSMAPDLESELQC